MMCVVSQIEREQSRDYILVAYLEDESDHKAWLNASGRMSRMSGSSGTKHNCGMMGDGQGGVRNRNRTVRGRIQKCQGSMRSDPSRGSMLKDDGVTTIHLEFRYDRHWRCNP
jgi:hypothetical protein